MWLLKQLPGGGKGSRRNAELAEAPDKPWGQIHLHLPLLHSLSTLGLQRKSPPSED